MMADLITTTTTDLADFGGRELKIAAHHSNRSHAMTRYIILDNYSGYIWDEVEAPNPIEACRIMDAEHGAHDRDYAALRHDPKNTGTGYHVYEASEGFPAIDDGQDESELRRVQDQCEWVSYVSVEEEGR